MNNTAILDFDGTIFRNDIIDLGLLEEISSKHQEIIIVSNNSSIAHTKIENYLSPYFKYILTPQVLAKAIIQNPSIESEVCCSKEVFNYLQYDFYSSFFEMRKILEDLAVSSSKSFLEEFSLNKICIIGKVNTKILRSFMNNNLLEKYTLLGMNMDKFVDSQGLSKKTSLVGDYFEFKFDIGKTSFAFLDLIKNFSNHFNLNFTAVYGDNLYSDGKLACLLDIEYKRTIFGESKFSNLVSIS